MSTVFVFAGDSITCANRLWLPKAGGLGNGYVSMLEPALKTHFPDAVIYNKGYDGFTVPALHRRIKQDGLPKDTDYVTILIGINDIGVAMNTGVSLDELDFSGHYRRLLEEIRWMTDARLLCAGPFIFPHPREYANWIPCVKKAEKEIAVLTNDFAIPFLPLHDTLNEFAQKAGFEAVTTDGIHLTEAGHRHLASLLLAHHGVKGF